MLRRFKLNRYGMAIIVLVAVLSVACGSDETPGAVDADPAAQTTVLESPEFPKIVNLEKPVVRPDAVPEDLGIVWEAWSYLLDDYVDASKLDSEDFSEQAVRGMLRVLDDPQTSYLTPAVVTGSFSDVFRGDFEGIGAHVNMNRQGKLLIVSPIPGGPAEAADIRAGDIILEVDGESIEGLSLLEAVSKIRGPKGSTVTLLVKHLGALDPVTIAVKRGVIPLVSVILRSQPGDRFAHVRITNFYPNTAEKLREVILNAIADGAEGLILDVRNNDGGTLNAVVDIASMFLEPEDDLVLYVEKGDGTRTDWRVRVSAVAQDIPMVLLVNERSASSSEVLAGALQDHERATVIGTSTFGKGSVNILRPLSNGGGLYITIAHWYTPLGRLIQGDGLTPDIVVENRVPRDADVQQLRRAIEELEQMVGSGNS